MVFTKLQQTKFEVNTHNILFVFLLFICLWNSSNAQTDWIAPEGFTVNQRTLTWDDFKGKEDKDHAASLASRNLMSEAYVCPAIYFTVDSGKIENGKVKFNFHIKCAFQSLAFVRKPNNEEHSNYVLIHEQNHYDIALTYARKLQEILSGSAFSETKYQEEIEKAYHDLIDKYNKTQKTYDGEVNPEGRDDKPKQYLWDKRVKKCLENYSIDFYTNAEPALQSVANPGTIVKRIPGEPTLQFVVRARPLYTEFTNEMKTKIYETTEWSQTPGIIAFYTQKYYSEENAITPNFRTMAYIFMPTANDYYKRILIDTFTNDGKQVRINQVFFANADTDQAKELVIMASFSQPDGVNYYNRIYDNIFRPMPIHLRRLDEDKTKIESGFEGIKNGKACNAKFKTKYDITESLEKAGYK